MHVKTGKVQGIYKIMCTQQQTVRMEIGKNHCGFYYFFENLLNFLLLVVYPFPIPGGGTSQKFGWGCAVHFWKPLPYFRPNM